MINAYLEVLDDFEIPIFRIKLTPREQELLETGLNISDKRRYVYHSVKAVYEREHT
jgi:hypothetical protein